MGFVVFLLIFIIGLMVVSAIVKGNRRVQFGDTEQALREAQEGLGRMPSWSLNDSKAHEFYYIVSKLAVLNGVPEAYAKQAFAQPTPATLICAHIAGNMEAKGASFNAQKLAAAEVFQRIYRDATGTKRARFVTPVADLKKSAPLAQTQMEEATIERRDRFASRRLSDAERRVVHEDALHIDQNYLSKLKLRHGSDARTSGLVPAPDSRWSSSQLDVLLRELQSRQLALAESGDWSNYRNICLEIATVFRKFGDHKSALRQLAVAGCFDAMWAEEYYDAAVHKKSFSSPTQVRIMDSGWESEIERSELKRLVKACTGAVPALANWRGRHAACDVVECLIFFNSTPDNDSERYLL